MLLEMNEEIDKDRHDPNKATKLAAAQVLCGLTRRAHMMYSLINNWNFRYEKRIDKNGNETRKRIRERRKFANDVNANTFTSYNDLKKCQKQWFIDNNEWKCTPFVDNNVMGTQLSLISAFRYTYHCSVCKCSDNVI